METVYDSFNKRNLPIVFCKPDGKSGWKFKCPYCKCNHYHSPEEGPRVAHCTNNQSPYKYSGYYLKLEKEGV